MMAVRLLAVALVALVVASPSTGQDNTAAPPESLTQDVAGIRRALEQLVSLLEVQRGQRDAEILLRRIELKERRLAPLEGRAREAESEVDALEGELRRLGAMREEIEGRIDAAIREGTDSADSEDRRILKDIQSNEKGLGGALDVATLRQRQAEDPLSEAREEIELLDEALRELLK